jgi:hypothetical protein
MYRIDIQEDLPAAKYCFCILPSILPLAIFITVKLDDFTQFSYCGRVHLALTHRLSASV